MTIDVECLAKQKLLGKITSAEFGIDRDMPFLYGLKLEFSFQGLYVSSGSKYMINISPECKWAPEARREAIEKQTDFVYEILKDAKCFCVSELKGKPVEITYSNGLFDSFRILTEVL